MHDLQPKHIKLTNDEKEKLLARFNISLSQFPKISLSDPCLPEGEFVVGDVVKINRKDEYEQDKDYYRVVVK